MDPYLESPDIWPDLHDALAGEIRNELNHSLPAPYYARLEMRPEVGIVEEGKARRRIVPDVTVVARPGGPALPGEVAVLERPRRELSRSFEMTVRIEPIRHHFVEVRDSMRGHELVTLIELLSPSNKRPGPDRDAYRPKQGEVLEGDASLIELDLLRGGERALPDLNLGALVAQLDPPPAYTVLISRAWQRAGGAEYQVFPCGLREWLPCIPIPLRQGEPELPLDLQFVFNRAYDGGPYRRGAVDYTSPPDPPLSEPDAARARSILSWPGTAPPIE